MVADRRICTREGHLLRIVRHTDPVGGESYEFLTHVMDLPAGVVAELYRRRWEAEKVFDEIKNRLAEKKAWASCLTGKETQAQLVVLTHNLFLYGQRRAACPSSAAAEPAYAGETEEQNADDGRKVLRFRDGSQIITDQIERSEIEG